MFYMMLTIIFFSEIPVDLLISDCLFNHNFAHRKISNNRSLNVWLALNVSVVYNSDRIVSELT